GGPLGPRFAPASLTSGLASGQEHVGVVREVELGALAAEGDGDGARLVRVAGALEGAAHLAGGGEPVVLLHAPRADVDGPAQGDGRLGGVGVELLAAELQE